MTFKYAAVMEQNDADVRRLARRIKPLVEE